ncbi:hypothetical protein K450DRAFT_225548 [Umbelopsis ramanniana AG]|uniref:FAD-binding domain-containing protein n=1 Tax=Umbelopsis ramanniana AG TaxID=1314678 RepID=A0AAD5EH51_UMBRA|nr:uncharacterized protein K450DRAFT_225548 [Umbelopsis ramanniana AG]KAI8582935.1 hypothetical protein K450DRAFT_225548 [Umbelopsis ramanniana AG]
MLEVLICGAGPVGSFFANLMEQFGHTYRIIDSEPIEARLGQSRALLLTARTLEVMEDRDIAREILSRALLSRGIRLHSDTKQLTEVEMSGLDSTFHHMTTLPQWRIEEILHKRLSKKVERPVKLISYVQESDHVVAKLQHGDDTDNIEEVKAKFLIGADGVHSTVRKGTPGWNFDGVVINSPSVLADVTFTGDKLPDFRYFNFIDSKNGALILIPIPDNSGEKIITRMVVSLGALSETKDNEGKVSQGIKNDAPPTLEELQTLIDQRCGYFNMKAVNPQWIAKFGINERRANGFRRGRCFVMGDAAHCHSPAGGQGLNLGFQDANNLAWKISSVLKNTAENPEVLLDSYYEERYPIIDTTINGTGRMGRSVFQRTIFSSFMRSLVLPMALTIPSIHDKVGFTIQQLWITIPTSSALLAEKSASSIIEPGKYMPDSCTLNPKDIVNLPPQTIKSIFKKTDRYIALLVWNHAGDDDASAGFWNLLQTYKRFVRPIVVESKNYIGRYRVPQYARNNADGTNGFWCDTRGRLAELLGIEDNRAGIILVRPDMYVAFSESYDGQNEIPLESFERHLSSQVKSD